MRARPEVRKENPGASGNFWVSGQGRLANPATTQPAVSLEEVPPVRLVVRGHTQKKSGEQKLRLHGDGGDSKGKDL